jgi:hypothetical protein
MHAQAASMARQSDAALRNLLRIQATREKQEAAMHPAAMERAGLVPGDLGARARPDARRREVRRRAVRRGAVGRGA